MMPNPEGFSDLNKVFDFVIENQFFNKKQKFASILCLGELREATYLRHLLSPRFHTFPCIFEKNENKKSKRG